ncbi:DMT(drug/metabolite transporter) superfamily permease [Mycolicibacterium chubuense NBB4]|uniref:DMT(Drug/metabolite transporter) superfamily permease n=1 Tax=Mycolicibacterium chubuense (strain NBB4) TaxID=710421 RepID=I4BHK1_MYCCN|nr:DMT family transporter [Mycolicibacterium chubuense]AFM16758.1 DMT(drug/metabolite transporter) superfamily permease [Mycolicibacterium chubuense NBB4]
MPFRAAAPLTFVYALGYPIGALAVSAMSPMGVLLCRFGLAGALLSGWAVAANVRWPTRAALSHVLVSGLLTQAGQFICLYLALLHGAPAVLGAVIISMNPVVTAALAALALGERLTVTRVCALLLGVLAVLAACAGRLVAVGHVDGVVLLLLVSLLCLAAGGVYQQRFCSRVDYRATAALQNLVAVVPVAGLAVLMPLSVIDPWKAAAAVAAVVLCNATLCMTWYVQAINAYGASAVTMLFAVIPAVAGLLSWAMLGQRPDVGLAVGLALGAAACWLNARNSRQQRQNDPAGDGRGQHRVDAVHETSVAGQ